ncbi:hypothetical protein [Xylophilus sp.]|uniref:hypothetical protein n=1 Tax=Xylophilus sp. TaxID=2653893 RepID=UPI0013BE76DF|nr:hypothetical protein [Xylophilus sp.]KAF1047796.1 MAG: hypothetical protein GAK38_01739 [Xylophilus sp.]
MKQLLPLTVLAFVSAWNAGSASAAEDRRSPENLQAYCEAEMARLKENVRQSQMADCLAQGRKREEDKAAMCEKSARPRPADRRSAYLSDCMKKN